MQEPLRGLGQAGEPGYVPLAYQYPVSGGRAFARLKAVLSSAACQFA